MLPKEIFVSNTDFSGILHFFFTTDSIIRNDTTRVIQPEIIFRSDNIAQTSGNTIGNTQNNAIEQRKGSVAIGQSVFYTDYPPQEYGNSGESNEHVIILRFQRKTFLKINIYLNNSIWFLSLFQPTTNAAPQRYQSTIFIVMKLALIHMLGKYLIS